MAPKRSSEEEPASPRGGGKKAKKHETTDPPPRNEEGQAFFLLKKQVDVLDAKDLEKAPNHTAPATGLHNHVAKKVMEHMREGDEVLLYRYDNSKTGAKAEPAGITAVCSVAKAPYPDPTDEEGRGFLAVDLKLEEAFEAPISHDMLRDHKNNKELRNFSIFKKGVSTVHSMTPEQFEYICNLE